jgi:hypothetical protein
MADNDQFRILVGGTASNAGFVEIATADDGTEPIHVRQYTGVFTTLTRTATLLDGSGNTSFPGTLTAGSLVRSGGTSAQFLKADGSVDSNSYITSASVGNGTLTLNVSGTGLSGSQTFTANQSGNATFTVTSNATSANTANAIVARDGSGNFSAGTITATLSGTASAATIVNGTSGQLKTKDDRIIEPNSITASRMQFGFTSWANNNASPYADYLHLRSYADSSGGNDNLVMFRKDAIGMRIYQQSFGSGTAYSSVVDVWHTGNDGAGSGLDADLLDGKNTGTSGNVVPLMDGSNTWSGSQYFPSVFSAEAISKDDITTRTSSGFWQTSTATTAEGWPITTNGWFHLLSSTHSNTANYYSMQFAGHFDNSTDIYYRSTNGSGTAAWNKMWHAGNDGSGSGLDADLLDGKNTGTSGNTIPLLDGTNTWSAIQTFGEIRPTADNAIVATGTAISDDVWGGSIEIREINQVGNTQTGSPYAPGITFHWGNVAASAIKMYSDASIRFIAQGSTGSSYRPIHANQFISNVATGTAPLTVSSTTVVTNLNADLLDGENLVDNASTANTVVGRDSAGGVIAVSFTSTSDINLKTNIKPIVSPISKLLELNGVTFDWKETKESSIGVIAQEVERVFPELIKETNDNYKTVNYNGLVGVLIEAIKEQQNQIEELKSQINKS